MNGKERHDLVLAVACKLQEEMTTSEINVFLGGYGIPHRGLTICDSKRVYACELLADASDEKVLQIASDLDLKVPNNHSKSVLKFKDILTSTGLDACHRDFERALENVSKDTDSAIGNASSTLESICKALLDHFNEPYPKDESLSPLLKIVFRKMNMSPDGHADSEIRRILGGLLSAGTGLGVLRTKYSSFHGKGSSQTRLEKRHARLAVNSLAAIGLFLIETYQARFDPANESLAPNS